MIKIPPQDNARWPGPPGRTAGLRNRISGLRHRIDAFGRTSAPLRGRIADLRARVAHHHLPLIAAGLSFYSLLAIFPALLVFLSLYGLIGDPRAVERHLLATRDFLPEEMVTLLAHAMHQLITHPVRRLSVSLLLGLAMALASTIAGAAALMRALNIVFELPETRGFLRRQGIALCLTGGLAVMVGVLLGVTGLRVTALRQMGVAAGAAPLLAALRWPVAALLIAGTLAQLYRLAPDHGARPDPRRRFLLGWGTLAATAGWIGATAGFALYVATFHSFDRIYGSIGAVIVLMVWLYLTALVVLVGAAIHHIRHPGPEAGSGAPGGTRTGRP